jgi:hypothetical protein
MRYAGHAMRIGEDGYWYKIVIRKLEDVRVIYLILRKWYGSVRTGLIWVNIKTSGARDHIIVPS